MFEEFDEAELLALVEGELDPARARALEAELRDADPRALEAIERMRADRKVLTALEPPEVPGDLLTELEPLIARPMLMAPPGQVRRRYRRQQRRRLLPLAAAVAVTFVAGIWATVWFVSGLDADRTVSGDVASGGPASEPFDVATGDRVPVQPLDVGDKAVPGPPVSIVVPDREPTTVARKEARDSAPMAATGSGGVETARFQLVLRGVDAAAVERLLTRALGTVDSEHALVRNLTMAEAQTLTEDWQRERVAAASDAPAARADGSGRKPLDLRVQPLNERPLALPAADDPDAPVAEQLVGPRKLAPSFDQQLEFSTSGCAYTIAVRLADLDGVLAHLQLVEGRKSTLQSLDGGQEGGAGWMDDYAKVRSDLMRLRAAGGDVIVHVPVRVQD
ncbi:MAG: anti-sigma factor [Planctomycetota bacterium]|jgi:hypothetical protein